MSERYFIKRTNYWKPDRLIHWQIMNRQTKRPIIDAWQPYRHYEEFGSAPVFEFLQARMRYLDVSALNVDEVMADE